jgi:hypothetical protein
MELRALGGSYNHCSVCIRRGIQNIAERGYIAWHLAQKSCNAPLHALLPLKSKIRQRRLDEFVKADTKQHGRKDGNADGCGNAVQPPLHQAAPFMVTGAENV